MGNSNYSYLFIVSKEVDLKAICFRSLSLRIRFDYQILVSLVTTLAISHTFCSLLNIVDGMR